MTDSIEWVLGQLDQSVSVYNKASLVSAINDGDVQRVDAYFKRLYLASLEVYRQSGGAFDPTVMPLVNAWGFGYQKGTLPTQTQIDSLLAYVGMDKTQLQGDMLIKQDPRTQFDFSSIAKGLACDEVGKMLLRNGITNWLVEIGGEVAMHGVNASDDQWHVSVDVPTEQNQQMTHEAALVVAVDSGGIATSGNYRKFRDTPQGRFSHIVNPLTGSSKPTDLLSVSVVATDCMMADAWATACMVLGKQQVHQMMQSRSDVGVMTISLDSVGNYIVWSNKAFSDHIVTSQP